MSDPMEKSLQGTSQFVAFEASLEQSMCGNSQKVAFENASMVNRLERQRDLKALEQMKKQQRIQQKIEQQDSGSNQFMNVGKWGKQKQQQLMRTYQNDPTKQLNKSNLEEKSKMEVKKSVVKEEGKKTESTVSKWNKNKSNKNIQSSQSSNQSHSHYMDPIHHVKPEIPKRKQQPPKQQEEEEEQDEDEEQEEDEEEDEEQSQEEQQSQDEQQDDEQEDDEEGGSSDQGWDEEQPEEQDQEQQEQIEDKFADGNQYHYEQSTDQLKTETVNTSALNRTPQPAKWNKKAPLETKTKYEVNTKKEDPKNSYHQRLNSANFQKQPEGDEIDEDLPAQNIEQWGRVEKILLRIKGMI